MIAIISLWKPQFLLMKAEVLKHEIMKSGFLTLFSISVLSVLEAEIYRFRIMHLARAPLWIGGAGPSPWGRGGGPGPPS